MTHPRMPSAKRLSHAYCPACDVVFPQAFVCPRCRTVMDLIQPPAGSPILAQPVQMRDGKPRQWIGRS